MPRRASPIALPSVGAKLAGMADSKPATPAAYWQQHAGELWVRRHRQTELQLAPLGQLALDALAPVPGERALDVGCGAGSTVVALARAVGPAGQVCGVDVSPPMIEGARQAVQAAGLTRAEFLVADAQTAAFPTPFDLWFSRFGVMFFPDPTAAFANLRQALVPGGRAAFVCWQGLDKNPWAELLLDAVVPLVPGAEVPSMFRPGFPGPFVFGDGTALRGHLEAAGYKDIRFRPQDVKLHVGGATCLEDAVDYCLDIGPAGRVFADAGDAHRPAFAAAIRSALAPYAGPTGVVIPGAVLVVTARNSP
jgi:ubiquinone/menaquinone biosynthesis C-methylase UbiE